MSALRLERRGDEPGPVTIGWPGGQTRRAPASFVGAAELIDFAIERARSPARRIDLDDRQWATSNEAVVRGFWDAVASEYKPLLPAEMTITAIERAEGNVLHAVMLHDALRGLPAPERRADRIPRGLRGLIGGIWNHAASDESMRVGQDRGQEGGT